MDGAMRTIVSPDRDIASIPGAAAAVDNAAVSEQQIVRLGLSSRERRESKNQKRGNADDGQLAHVMKSPIFRSKKTFYGLILRISFGYFSGSNQIFPSLSMAQGSLYWRR